MKGIGQIRTALFVPGNQPDRVDKAIDTAADIIVIDLEDAVPVAQKKETRPVVSEKVRAHKSRHLFVRINALGTKFADDDLKEVVVEGLMGIMVPKLTTAEHLRWINRLLTKEERDKGIPPGSIAVIPLIETARAVENAFQIASEKTKPNRLFTLAFGAGDFALDMGIELTKSAEEISYPRARIAVACRAAAIPAPLDTPFVLDLKDMEALEADAQKARQLGYQGKLCVHPNQIEICNRLFLPTEEEIEFSKRVIAAFSKAEADGVAAILVEGKVIEYAQVARARQILRLVES